jgi:atypical dual specificity phosphatase
LLDTSDMGLLKSLFPQLRSHERLSSVLPTKSLALLAFGWSAAYLFMWPNGNQWWAVLPFILMATKGVDITVVNGLFLSAFWMSYTLLITCPLYVFVGRYIVLMIYLPILGVVFYKEPHQKADVLFLTVETVFWDFPLICWMRVISKLNGRALKPFYSQITDEVAVGSMPLEIDAAYLHEAKNIGLVVNMCREYVGPLAEYGKLGIKQIHLPTPDVCEPKYEDVLRGVHEILEFLDAQRKDGETDGADEVDGITSGETTPSVSLKASATAQQSQTESLADAVSRQTQRVFIHCKAGRGRAATMALCYLIASTDMHPNDAMRLIKERRSVVEPGVRNFKVVRKFIQRLQHYDNDFDALYMHDYVLATAAP